MAFLVKHIEKIVLVLILVGCLGCAAWLQRGLQDARQHIARVRAAIPAATEGPTLAELDPEEFKGEELLKKGPPPWRIGDVAKGTRLFRPGRYVWCINSDCQSIVKLGQERCMRCDTPQRVAPPPRLPGEDTDRDGIPDEYEDAVAFLNSRNRGDAARDNDGDLFTNLEEYEAETDLADAASHPPLVLLLRFLGVSVGKRHPLFFKALIRHNSPDKKDWSILLRYLTPGRHRERSGIFHVGDSVLDYRIVDVVLRERQVRNPSTNMVEVADTSELILEHKGDRTVVLIREQPAPRMDRSTRFLFMTDRANPANCPGITIAGTDPVVLAGPTGRTETYHIMGIRRDRSSVLLRRVDGREHGSEAFVVARTGVRRHKAM